MQISEAELTEQLRAPHGVFVTLKKQGELRGCIGKMDFERPLWVNALDAAVASALEDPRFSPVEPQELVQRNLSKTATLDYWESGMDLGLSRNVFDSFLKYQAAMGEAFRQLEKSYHFDIIDANRSVGAVTKELRKKIGQLLQEA